MIDIRYPNITGENEAAQLMQVKSYLHQLVDQLNMALAASGGSAATYSSKAPSRTSTGAVTTDKDVRATFNSIKALIIKSADIVNAYYDEINYRMSSVYVAESVFGDYAEKTDKLVEETAGFTKELYDYDAGIVGRVKGIEDQLRETDGYIKRGIIDTDENGYPVIGIEVGQTNKDESGEETFNKFARFTANRLEFYDSGDQKDPVAYISGSKLYITTAQVLDIFLLGGFKDDVQDDGSVVTKWVGV